MIVKFSLQTDIHMKYLKILTIFYLNFNFIFAAWETELKNKIEQNSPPKWMIHQISSDLKSYKDNEKLDLTLQEEKLPGDIALFKIKNGSVNFIVNLKATKTMNIIRAERLKKHIQKLSDVCMLPEITFPVFLWDIYDNFSIQWKSRTYKPPVFLFSKKLAEAGILIPDVQCLDAVIRFERLATQGAQKFPWDKKLSKGFWRGAVRGGLPLTINQLKKTPRCQLVMLSNHFPKELDAFFSSNTNIKKFRPFINENNLVKTYASIEEHLEYKYQILIDGNVSSWGRGLWQLLSNCTIFKVNSSYIQWYYQALKPYEHFIPIESDSSNLIEKIKWAKINDTTCIKIAQNATKFAQNNLKYSDMLYYIYLILNEFEKITAK